MHPPHILIGLLRSGVVPIANPFDVINVGAKSSKIQLNPKAAAFKPRKWVRWFDNSIKNRRGVVHENAKRVNKVTDFEFGDAELKEKIAARMPDLKNDFKQSIQIQKPLGNKERGNKYFQQKKKAKEMYDYKLSLSLTPGLQTKVHNTRRIIEEWMQKKEAGIFCQRPDPEVLEFYNSKTFKDFVPIKKFMTKKTSAKVDFMVELGEAGVDAFKGNVVEKRIAKNAAIFELAKHKFGKEKEISPFKYVSYGKKQGFSSDGDVIGVQRKQFVSRKVKKLDIISRAPGIDKAKTRFEEPHFNKFFPEMEKKKVVFEELKLDGAAKKEEQVTAIPRKPVFDEVAYKQRIENNSLAKQARKARRNERRKQNKIVTESLECVTFYSDVKKRNILNLRTDYLPRELWSLYGDFVPQYMADYHYVTISTGEKVTCSFALNLGLAYTIPADSPLAFFKHPIMTEADEDEEKVPLTERLVVLPNVAIEDITQENFDKVNRMVAEHSDEKDESDFSEADYNSFFAVHANNPDKVMQAVLTSHECVDDVMWLFRERKEIEDSGKSVFPIVLPDSILEPPRINAFLKLIAKLTKFAKSKGWSKDGFNTFSMEQNANLVRVYKKFMHVSSNRVKIAREKIWKKFWRSSPTPVLNQNLFDLSDISELRSLAALCDITFDKGRDLVLNRIPEDLRKFVSSGGSLTNDAKIVIAKVNKFAQEQVVDRFGLRRIGNMGAKGVSFVVDMRKMLFDYISRLPGAHLIHTILDCVVDAVAALYIVYTSRDAFVRTAAIHLFLSTHKLLSLGEKMAIDFVAYAAMPINRITSEAAASEWLRDASSFLKASISSPLMTSMKDLLISAAAMQFFPKDIAKHCYRFVGQKPPGSVLDIITTVLESTATLVSAGELLCSGKSISSMMFSPRPTETAVTKAKELLTRRDLLYTGLPPSERGGSTKYCARQYVIDIDETLAILNPSLKKMNPLKTDYVNLVTLVNALKVEQTNVRNMLASESRATPCAVIVHGTPCVGKSSVINWICMVMSAVRGREYHDSHIFHRIASSDYWEGYQPWSNPFIHYSEIGSQAKSIVQSQGDPRVTELVSVIDSVCTPVDMAFGTKGKNFLNPELVVADTNCPEMNLKHIVQNPAAYYRRFLFVEVKIKPEFRKGDTTSLDPSKCDGVRLMDPYELTLKISTALSNTEFTETNLCTNADCDTATNVLSAYFKEKIEQEEKIRLKKKKASAMDYGNFREPEEKADYAAFMDDFDLIENESYVETSLLFVGVLMTFFTVADAYYKGSLSWLTCEWFSLYATNIVWRCWLFVCGIMSKMSATAELITSSNVYFYYELLYPGSTFDTVFDRLLPMMSIFILFVLGISFLMSFVLPFYFVTAGCIFWLLIIYCVYSILIRVAIANKTIKLKSKMREWSGDIMNRIRLQFEWLKRDSPFESWSNAEAVVAVTAISSAVYFFTKVLMDITFPEYAQRNQEYNAQQHDWQELERVRHLNAKHDIYDLKAKEADAEWRDTVSRFIKGSDEEKEYRLWQAERLIKTHKKLEEMKEEIKPKETLATEGSTIFENESAVNAEIQEIEEKSLCDRSTTRVQGSLPNAWNIQHLKNPLVHTGLPSTLDAAIAGNLRRIKVYTGFSTVNTYCLGVTKGFVLLNGHSIPRGDFKIQVSKSGKTVSDCGFQEHCIEEKHVFNLGNDVVLINISQQFRDITKHFNDCSFQNAKGSIAGVEVLVTPYDNFDSFNEVRHEKVHITKGFAYDWMHRPTGACGTPLIVGVGSSSFIAGIHCAGVAGTSISYAAAVDPNKLKEAISTLTMSNPLMNIISQSDETMFGGVPHKRSPFRFVNFSDIEYLGGTEKSLPPMSESKLIKSKLSGDLAHIFSKIGKKDFAVYCPPMMKPGFKNGEYVSPVNVNLSKMNVAKKSLWRNVLNECVDAFIEHVSEVLVDEKKISLNPLTMEIAINGDQFDSYLKRINASTGGGFGFPGKKFAYMPIVSEEQGLVKREPTDLLKRAVLNRMVKAKQGISDGTVFSAKLKDEPRSIEKVNKGKTRMFFPAPVDALIHARMYLAPLFTLMVQFNDIFNMSVGINMHSEGGRFYDEMASFADDEESVFDGDYGGYDTSMPVEIGLAASTFVYKLAKKLGYNQFALDQLEAILSDNLFPVIEVNGDYMRIPGLMTSGSYGTAEFNCIRNNILMLYYFAVHDELTLFDYFNKFRVRTYGDDVTGVVLEEIRPYFDNVQYAVFCKEVYGMDFTAPDKSANTRRFRKLSELSFLKRTFVKHPTFGDVKAVLDYDSIHKMLFWTLPSDKTTEVDQMLSTVNSSLWELYLHLSEEDFTTIRSALRVSFNSNIASLPDSAFVTFEHIKSVLNPHTVSEDAVMGGEVMDSFGGTNEVSIFTEANFVPISLDLLTRVLPRSEEKNEFSILINEFQSKYDKAFIERSKMQCPWDKNLVADITKEKNYCCNRDYRRACDAYLAVDAKVVDLEYTLDFLVHSSKNDIRTESDEVGGASSGPVDAATITIKQNVTDVGGEAPEEKQLADTYHSIGVPIGLSMEGFLERPVLLYSGALPMDNPSFFITLNVWDLFTKEPTVRAKLRNYAFARFNLNVRVAISGSPFNYGRLMVAYLPFPDLVRGWQCALPLAEVRKRYLSQTYGCAIMDVKANEPVELEIPFINIQPMCRLFNASSSALAPSTSYDDFKGMGSMFLQILNPAASVSPTGTAPYVQVYVNATDVTLAGATGTVIGITTEADERETGPVEKWSSTAYSVVSAMHDVPYLGLYARASSIALGALTKVASLFGWSYPNLISEPMRMRPDPWQNGAQIIGHDTGKRITLDPKQELTVDPRVVAIDKDELVISSIANREALLHTFSWDETEPFGTIIWSAPVMPTASAAISNQVMPSPLHYAAMPFQYWHGSIKYRFEIVVSAFHRGKIAFGYEPNISQRTLISSSLDLNKQFLKIIDIQESQCVELVVQWNYPKPYARVASSAYGQGLVPMNSTFTDLAMYANGYVFATPFTELQSPDSSAVSINVYIAGDGVTFNKLSSINLPSKPAVATIITEADEQPIDCEVSKMTLAPGILRPDRTASDYFGEVPVSFRALMKRFVGMSVTEDYDPSGGNNILSYFPIFPIEQLSVTTATSTNATLYHYLRYAFLGQRGGTRRRLRRVTADNQEVSVIVGLCDAEVATASNTFSVPGIYAPNEDGAITFNTSVNAGIEFEVPFYTNNAFVWACSVDPLDTAYSAFDPKMVRSYYAVRMKASPEPDFLIEDFATGEDFTFMRWLATYPFTPPTIG